MGGGDLGGNDVPRWFKLVPILGGPGGAHPPTAGGALPFGKFYVVWGRWISVVILGVGSSGPLIQKPGCFFFLLGVVVGCLVLVFFSFIVFCFGFFLKAQKKKKGSGQPGAFDAGKNRNGGAKKKNMPFVFLGDFLLGVLGLWGESAIFLSVFFLHSPVLFLLVVLSSF